MDILNLYAALYHHDFSNRLTQAAASGPTSDDCSYLLFWVNHYYPQYVLLLEHMAFPAAQPQLMNQFLLYLLQRHP